jgi:hypothetical protein
LSIVFDGEVSIRLEGSLLVSEELKALDALNRSVKIVESTGNLKDDSALRRDTAWIGAHAQNSIRRTENLLESPKDRSNSLALASTRWEY